MVKQVKYYASFGSKITTSTGRIDKRSINLNVKIRQSICTVNIFSYTTPNKQQKPGVVTMSSRKYLSTAETSKLIRMALKESFPGVKFRVRSNNYAGGSSIDVSWTDGPANKLVESICKRFEASYFDGSIDYKGSRYHLLDGESVRMGADFIYTNRYYSDAAIERACGVVAEQYGVPEITAEAYLDGGLWRFPVGGYRDAGCAVRERLGKVSSIAAAEPSATLASIQFAGDDGYGQGALLAA